MPFKPHNDYILINFAVAEEETRGGLIMPGGSQKTNRAEVMAVPDPTPFEVSEGIHMEYVPLEPGQEVLIQDKGKCIEVEVDGKGYHVTPYENILGVFEG